VSEGLALEQAIELPQNRQGNSLINELLDASCTHFMNKTVHSLGKGKYSELYQRVAGLQRFSLDWIGNILFMF
jgi:hypothetical protein